MNEKSWFKKYTILTGLIIIFVLITSIAGLFCKGIYDEWAPQKYVQESRAQDIISLAAGIPFLIISMRAAKKEKTWAFPLWGGVLAYELYVYLLYSLGGVYNVFFPVYLAVSSLSMYTILGLFKDVNLCYFKEITSFKMTRFLIGIFFILITTVFGTIWLIQITKTITTGVVDTGHFIFVIDLIIVLPVFCITAIKLFTKNEVGYFLSGLLLIKFLSLCLSIILGQLFRYINNIDIEVMLLEVFIPLGLLGVVLTILYFIKLNKAC